MVKINQKFTPEDRLSILQEGDREGQAVTIWNCNIYSDSKLSSKCLILRI